MRRLPLSRRVDSTGLPVQRDQRIQARRDKLPTLVRRLSLTPRLLAAASLWAGLPTDFSSGLAVLAHPRPRIGQTAFYFSLPLRFVALHHMSM